LSDFDTAVTTHLFHSLYTCKTTSKSLITNCNSNKGNRAKVPNYLRCSYSFQHTVVITGTR